MKRSLPFLLFLFLLLNAMALTGKPPAKVYYNRLNIQVESPEEAVGYTAQESGRRGVVVRDWYMNGQMKSETPYVFRGDYQLAHGTQSHWNEQGQLVMEVEYADGQLQGALRTWYDNGQLRREEHYAEGVLQQGYCLDEQGQETDCPALYVSAGFPGGAQGLGQYVNNHLLYPPEAFREGAEGMVQVRLLVDTLGKPVDAIPLTRLHPALEAEAVRLVMDMPLWAPAREEGAPVAEVLDLQIPFRRADYEGLHIYPCSHCNQRRQPGDTLWLDDNGLQTTDRQIATQYLLAEPAGKEIVVQRACNMEGLLLEEVHYKPQGETGIVLHGPARQWDEEGRPLLEVMMHEDVVHGVLRSWWPSGQLRRHDVFSNGRLIQGTCFDEQGNEVERMPYYIPAEYPGGEEGRMQHLLNTLTYPKRARESGKSGTVFVAFTVDAEGQVGQAEITKSVFKDLDEEAIRVVLAMPRWKPAMQEGQPVETRMNMPVRFVLN